MCLSKVSRKFAGKGRKVYTVYKLFEFNEMGNYLLFPWFPYCDNYIVPTNKWIEDFTNYTIFVNGDYYNEYSSGFHCFATTKEVSKIFGSHYRLLKIKARKLVAVGTQRTKKVMVFKEIYVPKPRKRKNERGKDAQRPGNV